MRDTDIVIYKPKQPTDTRDTLVATMCLLFKEAWFYNIVPSQYQIWESRN